MERRYLTGGLIALSVVAAPVAASTVIDFNSAAGFGGGADPAPRAVRLPPYLQCVPFARQATGVQIFGDAHTWWGQAEGRYGRGHEPRVGAVMAFRAHGSSRLGHVAAVSKIVDSRTLLISHANWSPINGRRGQIERNVRAVDVSPNNDWSQVRVWFAPIKALGGTAWPVTGFIYNSKPGAMKPGLGKPGLDKSAIGKPQLIKVARTALEKTQLVKEMSARSRSPLRVEAEAAPRPSQSLRAAASTPPTRARTPARPSNDPIGEIITRRRR